jgi:S-adenosylmethionine:tRNA ribosyltransferase-isomerase
MLVADFDYELPSGLIAQHPAPKRDESRLLVLERATGVLHDLAFPDIRNWLHQGDLLVLNNTRVIPARIFGRLPTGGKLELLLLRQVRPGVWEALSRPARKARVGTVIDFGERRTTVLERRSDGVRLVEFVPPDIGTWLKQAGELALPPYIREQCHEPERYQTVYSAVDGAVAAPTAGLHFTSALLDQLRDDGVETATVTLHAGLGTFRPVKAEQVEEHDMHPEQFELTEGAAAQVNRALADGRRIVCVGTTAVRVIESRAKRTDNGWRVEPGTGETELYIYPGYEWRAVGAILTNFHLPKSTLLMLVSSFASLDRIREAYRHAIDEHYRFYSFGDAMLLA